MTLHLTTLELGTYYRCPHCPYFAVLLFDEVFTVNPGDGSAHTGAVPWWVVRVGRAREREITL